jgi:radical SAM superfamily enzyme YgiQ (UPF0313 family)
VQVLLINPPWQRNTEDTRARFKVISCLPSLGLGYLAACLEKEGFEVKVLDLNVEKVNLKDLAKHLSSLEFNPGFIGITSAATTIYTAIEIAGVCKEVFPASKMILGGVQPTVMPGPVISSDPVDFVVRGEGEQSFLELVRGEDPSSIKGLSYKDGEEIVHNPERGHISDLDELPFPAYHLFPMKKYHPPDAVYRRLPAINLITSRGCPFRCTYCATQTIWPGKLRMRSIENVMEELKILTRHYGIREISFSDDTLPAVRSRIVELCEGILKNKIDITWSCNAIVKFVDENVLRLMKRAGCHHICYGVESADTEILKNIKKNIKLEDAERTIRLTKKAGIACRASFMLGNPGETEESMMKTLKFTFRTNPDFALFNITTPYPGTPIYEWAKENGYLLSEDFSLYTGSKCLMDLPTVSPSTVEEFALYAWKSFYGRPGYIMGRLFKIRSIYDVRAYFNAFLSLLKI